MHARSRIPLTLLAWLLAAPLWAQQPVTVVNAQAVDYPFDAALTFGAGAGNSTGPVMQCRVSASEPTNATGDTRAFPCWAHGSGAIHVILTDNAGNPAATTTPYYLASAGTTNSTSVKNTPGFLHLVHLTNTTSTTYYLRLYDSASAPTCSSSTGFVRTIGVLGNSVNGYSIQAGEAFANGIAFCFTGGAANNDNSNAATGVEISLSYH